MEYLPLHICKLAREMFAGQTGLSGPEIHEFFKEYSSDIPDYSGGAPRWKIFENFLSSFPIEQQKRILLRLCEYDVPTKYGQPSDEDKKKLQKWLLTTPVTQASESALKNVSSASINEYWQKSLERVSSDPEGAITSARTLVETVCKYVLDNKGVSFKEDGNLQKLYKQTASASNLSPDQHGEDIFKQILSGSANVVNGLAGLRNAFGDAHGKGKRYVKPSPRHAKMAVGFAGTLATFLIETFEEQTKNTG
ncbi:MAG: abortive infection family protein [Chloroflexota bacterium]